MPLSAAGGLLLAERLPVLRAPAAAVMAAVMGTQWEWGRGRAGTRHPDAFVGGDGAESGLEGGAQAGGQRGQGGPDGADGRGDGDPRGDRGARGRQGGLRGLHVRRERLWPPCLAQNLATGKSEGRRGKASRQARWLRMAEGDPAYGEHEAADWRVREVGREGGLRLGIVQAAGAWRSGTRGGGRGSAEWGPLQPPAQEAEAVEGADILAELKAKGNPGSRRGRGSQAATGSDPKEMGHLTGSLYTPKP